MLRHQDAVLALVEEGPGLLARTRCGEVPNARLLQGHRVRHGAAGGQHFERQPLVAPHRGVVAEQDPLGREGGADTVKHVRSHVLEAGREQLRHDIGPVAIHHEGRQAVAFAVDHAERGGRDAGAPPGRRGDPVGPPGRVDRLAPSGEQAQPDFRLW